MSIRTEWQVNGVRRNYGGGAVVMRGALPLTRRAHPSRAWQQDVSRGLAELAKDHRVAPDAIDHPRDADAEASPLPASVRRLKALARSWLKGFPSPGQGLVDAPS